MPARVRDLSRFDSPVHTYKSMEDLATAPPKEGISTVPFQRMHFDVRFTDRGHDVTLVHLGAALAAADRLLPKFGGGGLARGLPVNHLSIADPNTSMEAQQPTGWYSGHRHFDATRWIPRVVEHFTAGGKALYFGSSAGGYGALVHSAATADALCVAVNPRTALFQLPSKFPAYAEKTFRGVSHEKLLERIVTCAWEPHTMGTTPVWYVQNMQDVAYRDGHYLPFKRKTAENPHIRYVTGGWGHGHVVPPIEVLTGTLRQAMSVATQSAPSGSHSI